MPRTLRARKGVRGQPQTMVSRIRAGKVVPLISGIIGNDLVLGGHTALAGKYAEYINYSLGRKDNLPQLVQFKSVMDDISGPWDLGFHYIDFVKNQLYDLAENEGTDQDILAEIEEEFDDLTFSEFSERLGYPKFDDGQDNPLLVLASFPLPIYLTTGYHNFIEAALKKAGKTPYTDICRWHDGLRDIPSVFDDDYEPSREEPLVYHLYGSDLYPESLVLTEDNHLEFLVAISENKGKDQDLIDGHIRQALVQSALILLGYSLRSWEFRSLFWGLIKQRVMKPKSVSVQISLNSGEEQYLEQYLARAEFEIFWGDVRKYVQQLRREWEGKI